MTAIDIDPPRVSEILRLTADASTENWPNNNNLCDQNLLTELRIMKLKRFPQIFRHTISTIKRSVGTIDKDARKLRAVISSLKSISAKSNSETMINTSTALVRTEAETRHLQNRICAGVSNAINAELMNNILRAPREVIELISAGESRIIMRQFTIPYSNSSSTTMNVD